MPAKINTKTAARKQAEAGAQVRCSCCGDLRPETEYYRAKGTMLWECGSGCVPICKACLQKFFEIHRERYGERMACILCCHYMDAPFVDSIYQSVILKQGAFDLGYYLRSLNGPQWSKKSFVTSILEGELYRDSGEEAREALEAKWTRDEARNRKEAIELLGNDPFDGYPDSDRKYLYGELAKYLDEDVLEDAYKLSVIIQLVTNNCQIRNYDLLIARADPKKDADTIKKLSDMKNSLVSANDKLAKENEISVKNRTNKDAGRSTLTYLMRDLRGKDFAEAQANYYDQLRSDGTLWAIEMSQKALLQNTLFDDNDRQEIFLQQRALVAELQARVDDLTEETRLLKLRLKGAADG